MNPKDFFEDGIIHLIDAIFWISIVDYVDGLKFKKSHEGQAETNKRRNYNYVSAVNFLKQSDKGKRILKILENLNDEQIEKLLAPGGLAWSNQSIYNKEEQENVKDED